MTHEMKKSKVFAALAAAALTSLFAPQVMACSTPAGRSVQAGMLASLPAPRLLDPNLGSSLVQRTEDNPSDPGMTGLWKTTMVSGGQVVMIGFDTWHSDGTELALDGSFPPATGNVCPGVWERTGARTYSTVHPAFEYDPTGMTIVAIFIERMHVTISEDGNSFQGTFTWDNYSFQGTLLDGSVSGTVTGTRIRATAPFPFPFPQ